ncbi:MAG: LptF/LptG family permease [Muribaculaceae bacterium]|nr:LptF/LptG family permease [Muribaculaceae bacterium]
MSFRIKKLYLFMVKTFLPLFMMTFMICLFIVMMQFLWRYIDDLVGKGLSIDLVAELFFYAALTLVPLALPLAILLASLMTFGNLGEHVELTAMKSSGISLVTVMKPLVVLLVGVAIGAFFFQNDVLPKSQVKMWTLLFSMRQKSPSLDIPEGSVYTQIPSYNLYVKHKNKENDMLYNLLIYDVSSGVGSPRIVSADSGRLSLTEDKQHLVLNLFQGNWYEEMHSGGSTQMGNNLYRREAFHDKEILIAYDDNFTRMDDEMMRQQYVGKNISELRKTIDSVQQKVDSVGLSIANELRAQPVVGVPTRRMVMRDGGRPQTEIVRPVKMTRPIDFDSLMAAMSSTSRSAVMDCAVQNATSIQQDNAFRSLTIGDDQFIIRRHAIELHRKFTLSLACLIFFFIGAPLGAIIRKGGLGMPVVISVLLFIFYYMIDNMGYKLARDGRWHVWQGIWLSSAVLLPLGVFLTKKAVNDSAVFNPDAWLNAIRRFMGLHQTRKLEMKEVVINEMNVDKALEMTNALSQSCSDFLADCKRRQGYLEYLQHGYDADHIRNLSRQTDELVEYLSNSRDQMVLGKAMDFPVIRSLATYQPTTDRRVGMALAVLFPVGLPLYLIGSRHQRNLRRDLSSIVTVCTQLTAILQGNYTRDKEYTV